MGQACVRTAGCGVMPGHQSLLWITKDLRFRPRILPAVEPTESWNPAPDFHKRGILHTAMKEGMVINSKPDVLLL